METRKLQRVGGGTYTVSVPKRWAVEHDLDAGAEVRLYAHADGSIVVRSAERDGAALDRIELDLGDADEGGGNDAPDESDDVGESDDGDGGTPDSDLVRRLLRAAYGAGYETVTLRPRDTFTDDRLRAARRTNRGLVGTEIVADGPEEFALRNVLETRDVSVRQTVVQLRFVARSALGQAAVAFEGRDADLDRLRERAEEADRLFEMVARHLNRSLVSMAELDRLGVDRPALFDYYVTAEALAAVTELSVAVGRVAGDFSAAVGDRLAAELAAAADDAEASVTAAATAVIEGASAVDAAEVTADCDAVAAALDDVETAIFDDPDAPFEGTAADARALTRLLDALGRIADRSAEIGTVAMRAAMRPDAG